MQLAYQLADSVTGFAYSFGGSCIILFIMNLIPGLKLRASEEAEVLGMDDAEIGEFAYDYVELTRDVINGDALVADDDDDEDSSLGGPAAHRAGGMTGTHGRGLGMHGGHGPMEDDGQSVDSKFSNGSLGGGRTTADGGSTTLRATTEKSGFGEDERALRGTRR